MEGQEKNLETEGTTTVPDGTETEGCIGRIPVPGDFDEYLPWACRQLRLHIDVAIFTIKIPTQGLQRVHSAKSRVGFKTIPTQIPSQTNVIPEYQNQRNASVKTLLKNPSAINVVNHIRLVTVYDPNRNLTQLKFNENILIPCQLLKIIGLILKYHTHVTKIVINRGLKHSGAYELGKLLTMSNITDICLDNNNMLDANFEVFLEKETHLKQLSLARCNIDDEVLLKITLNLAYPLPGSKTLAVLNLASNKITDLGAQYLAVMLRTNRSLRCLNIADNSITDEGARQILDILHDFVITEQEINSSKIRLLEDWKKRHENSTEANTEKTAVKTDAKKSRAKKTKLNPKNKPTDIEISALNEYTDPFSSKNICVIDNNVHCYGNNYLAHLNLAYNNVCYITIKNLLTVLLDQETYCRHPRGLVSVCIEGNYIPESCTESTQIDEILHRIVNWT